MTTASDALTLAAACFERWRLLRATRSVPRDPLAAAAHEAAAVRAMATRVRNSDPGFANDLCGAADRHERAAVAEAQGARVG